MRIIKGLSALIATVALLVGIPAGLILFAGNPIPSWDGIVQAMSGPDLGGRFLIRTIVPVVAWIAWATFALGFLLEIPNQMPHRHASRRQPVRVPGVRAQQRVMGVLLAAIVAAVAVPSVALAAPAPAHASTTPAAVQVAEQSPAASANRVAQPVTSEQVRTVKKQVVKPGDTLWGIAEEDLGSGERYGEIYRASQGTVQPGGQKLTDPNLIKPGWTVSVPTVETVSVPAKPAPRAGEHASAPSTDATGAGTSGSAAQDAVGAPSRADTSQGSSGATDDRARGTVPAAADAHATAEDDGLDWPAMLATAGGIGATLAAGILGLLGWRRVMQRRERRPGQRIATEDMTVTELELRAVESPEGVDAVDSVTRMIAAWAQDTGERMPALYALRLDEQEVSLYLTDPATLPEPFEKVAEDGLAWAISLEHIAPPERTPSAPYPALVALGRDENDGHMFVDLERLGSLSVTAQDSSLSDAALCALAVELAVNTWSEDARVTLVGVGEGLPAALRSGRVRHVEDVDTLIRDLTGQADAVAASLGSLGIDGVDQARASGPDADAWAPEVIMLGTPLDDTRRQTLDALVDRIPRVGIAAVAADGQVHGDWVFTVDDEQSARLMLPAENVTIPIIPQLVGAREQADLTALFDRSVKEAPTGEAIDDEPALDSLPARSDTDTEDTGTDTTLSEDTAREEPLTDVSTDLPPVLAAEAVPASEKQAVEPSTAPQDATTGDDEPDQDALSEPLAEVTPLWPGPYLRVLGPVELVGARGDLPMSGKRATQSRSTIKRGKEILAFLLLNPGTTRTAFSAAMWPAKPTEGKTANATRNTYMSRTRRWLGNDDDGTPYLPDVLAGAYVVHPDVHNDWSDFQQLTTDDIYTAPTTDLLAALRLVRGQPFADAEARQYGWADVVRQEMIAKIGDVSHEVAVRALEQGHVRNARMAAAIGRQVEPEAEVHWRDGIRAEFQAGDSEGVERLITQLNELLDQLDDEPAAETNLLIRQVRDRRVAS